MTSIEQEILDNLIALQSAAERMDRPPPKPDLMPILLRLDELTLQLPKGADPNLLHFLHRKSYQKAQAFLEERRSNPL